MTFVNLFYEISAILLLAAAVGALGLILRQPLIVSLLAAGVIVGPFGLAWISSHDQIELLAHVGISLLLFVVGLKLDLTLIKTMGRVALATGLGQVLFASNVGFFLALGLGLTVVASLYVAVALTFSSTIIIVKLLTDNREIDSLRGRVALTARWEEEAEAFLRAGADLVLRPCTDAAEQAVEILEKGEPDQGTTPAFPKGEHTAILLV